MKPTFLAVVALLGALPFLILFIADREIQAGSERLSDFKISPRSALDVDPSLKSAVRFGTVARTAAPHHQHGPATASKMDLWH